MCHLWPAPGTNVPGGWSVPRPTAPHSAGPVLGLMFCCHCLKFFFSLDKGPCIFILSWALGVVEAVLPPPDQEGQADGDLLPGDLNLEFLSPWTASCPPPHLFPCLLCINRLSSRISWLLAFDGLCPQCLCSPILHASPHPVSHSIARPAPTSVSVWPPDPRLPAQPCPGLPLSGLQ